jgi:site-specific recombinase XerD
VFLNLVPRWFTDAALEANVADFKWHDLRHTFASRLVMAGVDIRTVQELMGHKQITQTMRYAHLSPQHRTGALEKLSAQLPPKAPPKQKPPKSWWQ